MNEPTTSNPYAWSAVAYEDYLLAAEQIGLRPDLMAPQAGFSSGLKELCETSVEELAEMRRDHLVNTADSDTHSAADLMGEEISLRLGLACPQRMADWIETDQGENPEAGSAGAESSESAEVSDQELAEATAEETADESAETSYDEAGYGDTDAPGLDASDSDAADPDAAAETPSSAGSGAGANDAAAATATN